MGKPCKKPCETSYSYRLDIHVHPVRIAFCCAKPCQKNLFLQAVYEYTPCKHSISWRKTVQMSLCSNQYR